jgi:ribosomal protein S18 acetylase RimI-like enzyme
MPVTIRIAGPADAGSIDSMVRELATHEQSLEHVHVDSRDWTRLLERPDVAVFVAEDDGEAVGFTSTVRQLQLWEGRDLLALDDLYVRPSHRDRGTGRALMMAVAEHAATEDLLVRWGVRLDNASGQRFYARLGASLITKMIAVWQPAAYRAALASTTVRSN